VSYLTFTLRRLVAAVLVALCVSAITFVMLRVLRPEAFADTRPLPVQLADFL
jgi:ABC-type dipeptide/oligopeptide/nickel transport system permease component